MTVYIITVDIAFADSIPTDLVKTVERKGTASHFCHLALQVAGNVRAGGSVWWKQPCSCTLSCLNLKSNWFLGRLSYLTTDW